MGGQTHSTEYVCRREMWLSDVLNHSLLSMHLFDLFSEGKILKSYFFHMKNWLLTENILPSRKWDDISI